MPPAGDRPSESASGEAFASSLAGQSLGRYTVESELGRGGMAVVYRARDSELGREVAIKVLHGVFAGQGEIEQRFRREAQAIASIKHEGIVQIFEYEGPRGRAPAYIVAELVRGPTLKQLMDGCRGRLVPEIAALVVARVADALAAAHAQRIVHRDVKPDNIILEAPAGGRVRVLLADFGVAHMTGAETMTATGALVGSPAYMSPEQARGHDVTAQSDVFSLGVTLYQACTGHLPFPGKDPLAVVVNILRGEMKRPSLISPRVGADLERIILRCMRPLPAERYPDAGALRDDLRALARDTHLGDETPLLARLLSDPEGLERELAPRLAEHAFEGARAHGRRGQLTRALNELNRVFAYAPDHAGARAMVDRLSSRRRLGRVALIAAGVIALGGATGGAVTWVKRRHGAVQSGAVHRDTTVAIASPKASPAASGPAGTAPDAGAPAPLHQAALPADPAATPRLPGTGKSRPGAAPGRGKGNKTAPDEGAGRSVAEQPPEQPAPAAPAPQPPTPRPVAAAPVLPSTGTLEIRAWRGFCSPSVDDRSASMSPIYPDLPSGPHRVFCTLPQGERVLVGTYDLRGGTRPSLVIRPDEGGKPTLVRPQ